MPEPVRFATRSGSGGRPRLWIGRQTAALGGNGSHGRITEWPLALLW